VVVPSLRLFVPWHAGQLQRQHAVSLPISTESQMTLVSESAGLQVILCGFSRRAQHVTVSPSEEERPVDPERLAALNQALLTLTDVTGEQLMTAKYAGTPPARIYRSFASPRRNAVLLLEPVERAAHRAAEQIEMALRQVRADQAAYLRNTDRSHTLDSSANSSSSSSNTIRTHPLVLVLDNIRSAFNVGSMFRTAETAGLQEIVTCGITAHPPHPKLRKTAFSAADTVPSRHFDDIVTAITALRSEGYHIVVMETTSLSHRYTEMSYPRKTALVVGNEITGVDPRIIELADAVTEIPTFGCKNSLNVAAAAPIVIFEVLRQWNVEPTSKTEAVRVFEGEV
jgi:tRNA G18 (ribose-2'-O)-methylase SpoU